MSAQTVSVQVAQKQKHRLSDHVQQTSFWITDDQICDLIICRSSQCLRATRPSMWWNTSNIYYAEIFNNIKWRSEHLGGGAGYSRSTDTFRVEINHSRVSLDDYRDLNYRMHLLQCECWELKRSTSWIKCFSWRCRTAESWSVKAGK